MIGESEKSLAESISDGEMNEKSGPTMFCISPPPRKFSKRNTEMSKVLSDNINKEISPNTDLQSGDTRNESRQEKTAHGESEEVKKNVAFCVSPPARKPAKMNTQHIITKLRNGRMNAIKNTRRQPMKGDHSATTQLIDEKFQVKHTSTDANDFENEDTFTDNTVERKETQRESMLRMLKMCAENHRNIRKLRDEVAEAKTDIWKCCEEEEQWNCRSDIHKNRVNANVTKINSLKIEKPHLFPKPGEREITLDEVREDLMKCRADLIFLLSKVHDEVKKAINEKTMERRRLGVTYPNWFLSEFRGEYLKYRKTHGFRRASLSITRPFCPAIDIAVSVQKSTYNIKQSFKILIDGRQFSYRDIGLTQVMATVHEESVLHGEFGPVIPKTSLNKTENRTLFRKPQATYTIDVNDIYFNGCSNSLIALVDERLSIASNISLCPRIDHDNGTEIFLKDEDISNHQDTQCLQPRSLRVQELPNESILEKITSRRYLPPLRNTPSPNDNINTTDACKFWQNTEKVNSHFANGTRTEPKGIRASNLSFGRPKSEESIVAPQTKTTLKQCYTQVQNEIHNYEIDNNIIHGDVENSKQGNINTAKEKNHHVQEYLPPLVINDHIPKRKVWQTKHQILPEIKNSNEKSLITEGNIKRQINMSSTGESYSILCDPKMMPVKILHRDKRSNKLTYLTTLVNKDLIPPFSVARRGSSIPVRLKYLKKRLGIPRFEGTATHKTSLSAALSRNHLYTIKEATNDFDAGFSETDETTITPVSSPFYQNKIDRSNSSFGSNQEEMMPSRIPVPCNGTKTYKIADNAAQRPSRIPIPCRGNKTTENARERPSHSPVPCRGNKISDNVTLRPSRIPVPCRGTKTAENAAEKLVKSRYLVAGGKHQTMPHKDRVVSQCLVAGQKQQKMLQKGRVAPQ